jgi:phage tail sheath protein FI
MAIQVSPGVAVSEVDLTTSVPAISTSVGGFAGVFNWGPANTPVQITSEVQLNNTFGNPDNNTAISFFTAANFLAYSNNMQVVRAQMHDANNATASGVLSPPIPNDSFYFDNYFSGSGEVGNAWASRYMGSLGNSLQVIVWSAYNWATDASGSSPTTKFARKFDYAPSTSPYVVQLNPAAAGVVNDEIHIMVVDATGAISGYANTVLEKYQSVSVLSDATAPDGSSNYYKNVIYGQSKYIHWLGIPQANTANWGNTSTAVLSQFALSPVDPIGLDASVNSIALMGGTDGSIGNGVSVSSAIVDAISYNLFDPESIDISLLMAGNSDANVISTIVDTAENRTDCVAFFSPDLANTQNTQGAASSIVNFVNSLDVYSSYAVCDSGWKYQYDKYNDVYRWVPLNGDIAGLCAYTDRVQAPWWSPAGLNRGVIKNVVRLAFNPNQAARDTLYQAGINPVVSFPGQGTILYGDKTLLNRPSAFDRINVRRLFIVLEKSISQAARSTLFEFNDEFTQSQFVALIDPFLRTVQAQRGIYSYKIVCDSTNNTSEVIDANQFVGDIFIQPAKSINFIQLNFVATRTGVDFSQIVGQF